KQSSLAHAWPNSRTPIDPLTLSLTSLQPHAVVPSLLSVEGKRIVLPAFFQRGRDTPDKTRQTLATAHAPVRHADAPSRQGGRCRDPGDGRRLQPDDMGNFTRSTYRARTALCGRSVRRAALRLAPS